MSSGEIAYKPENIAGMVDYQDGAIVSRTISDKPSGTITLFAFAQGQALSEHTAPFDAMIVALDGQAEVTISGSPHSLNRGEMIIMPANKPHAVKATDNFKMLLVMIKG
ncbi:MAG: cupin domain-containing protein [Phycisphaerae bacterium]|nr:cupin domain-containing protein [Phycisphaerae bacterium]